MKNGQEGPILETGWQMALEVPFLRLAGMNNPWVLVIHMNVNDPYILDVSN
jgi:hypothetical protein